MDPLVNKENQVTSFDFSVSPKSYFLVLLLSLGKRSIQPGKLFSRVRQILNLFVVDIVQVGVKCYDSQTLSCHQSVVTTYHQ